MNQDQVREKLLQLEGEAPDFTLLFSGKSSRKVDGLYHPEKREIIIHNKNFEDDNALMYTAIHEFTHHIRFSRDREGVMTRSHTGEFWNIFHTLLRRAEELGIYVNLFEEDQRFKTLTTEIKEKYLAVNGQVMKDFGKLLIEALDLCQQNHAIFEDYVDRALGINRKSAKSLMKVYALDVDPEIGYENMRIVAGIQEPQKRRAVERAFKEGKPQNEIKEAVRSERSERAVTAKGLTSQKRRLEKSIQSLQAKIEEIERQLQEMDTPEA